MQIFSSNLLLRLGDGTICQPFCRYVVSNAIWRQVEEEIAGKGTFTASNFNPYLKPVEAGKGLGKRTIAIYRHGAFGDTLILTALLRHLRRWNPDAVLDVYCRPECAPLLHGLGVRAIQGFPTFDALQRYDGHILMENMLECDHEPDQGPAIDSHFRFCGIDPAGVPDEDKVPVVVGHEEDEMPWDKPTSPYIVLQVNASNSNRTWPHVEELISRLPLPVVRVGDSHAFPRFRNLIPVIRDAALVICPDSSIGHLAAAFPSVPVISLWGLFHPNDRAAYYKNHHPLFLPEACPHAPCHSHLFSLPLNKCNDAPGFDGKSCAALAAITPEMVVAKAKEILKL